MTRRPKLACRACGDVVVQAPAPVRLIEGGLPTEALVAHVLVSRYADHLPLHRQAQIIVLGRKRVALVDADGTWLAVAVVPASTQERDTLPALDAACAAERNRKPA